MPIQSGSRSAGLFIEGEGACGARVSPARRRACERARREHQAIVETEQGYDYDEDALIMRAQAKRTEQQIKRASG